MPSDSGLALNGRIPKDWAKGRTKQTDQRIARNAEARRGIPHRSRLPPEQRRRGTLRVGSVIWDADLAYGAGLIATDGCLVGNRHIAFTSKDREQIDTFLRCVRHRGARVKIVTGPMGGSAYQVTIGDVVLYRWLVSIGITPRKSLTLGGLEAPEEYFLHVVRGLLDGDGSIRNFVHAPTKKTYPAYRYERLGVHFYSASRPHLEWLRERLRHSLAIDGYLGEQRDHRRPNGNALFTLRYAKRASIALLTKLYADPNTPRLGRKWEIWNSYRIRKLCAEGGIRTLTGFRPHGPEPCASRRVPPLRRSG